MASARQAQRESSAPPAGAALLPPECEDELARQQEQQEEGALGAESPGTAAAEHSRNPGRCLQSPKCLVSLTFAAVAAIAACGSVHAWSSEEGPQRTARKEGQRYQRSVGAATDEPADSRMEMSGPSSVGDFDPLVPYLIENVRAKGMYMNLIDGQSGNGAGVLMVRNADSPRALWLLEREPGGAYTIESFAARHIFLNVIDNCLTNGARLHLWSNPGSTASQFHIERNAEGVYTFENVNAEGEFLTAINKTNHTNVLELWDVPGLPRAQWLIRPATKISEDDSKRASSAKECSTSDCRHTLEDEETLESELLADAQHADDKQSAFGATSGAAGAPQALAGDSTSEHHIQHQKKHHESTAAAP